MSESLILGIVTACLSLVSTMFAGVMAYLIAKLNQKQQEAAVKVEAVATKLEQTTAVTVQKIDGVSAQVEEVRHQGNGMKTELVEAVREAAFARGVKSETDKKGES